MPAVPIQQRSLSATLTKAAARDTDHDGAFVLNEESPDRMGDIIEASAWDLDDFYRNPVALWQHDADRPIGIWEDVRVEGKQLLGKLRLASTNLAAMARQLIQDGVLRAVSVGFIPIEHEPIDKKDPYGGWRIKAAKLLEVSLVSIPAHANALLLSKSLGLSQDERRLIFGASQSPRVAPDPEMVLARAREAARSARCLLR